MSLSQCLRLFVSIKLQPDVGHLCRGLAEIIKFASNSWFLVQLFVRGEVEELGCSPRPSLFLASGPQHAAATTMLDSCSHFGTSKHPSCHFGQRVPSLSRVAVKRLSRRRPARPCGQLQVSVQLQETFWSRSSCLWSPQTMEIKNWLQCGQGLQWSSRF